MLSIMKVGMCIIHIGYKSLCVQRLCLCVKVAILSAFLSFTATCSSHPPLPTPLAELRRSGVTVCVDSVCRQRATAS